MSSILKDEDQSKSVLETTVASAVQPEAVMPKPPTKPPKDQLSPFASVRLSVFLMSLMALTIMIGAAVPQESQNGPEKVFEVFGKQTAEWLVRLDITDIYHSPWFLALTATLTLNMVVVSFQRVFPKLRLLKNSLPFFRGQDILKLPVHQCLTIEKESEQSALLAETSVRLTKMGYKVKAEGLKLKGEYGLMGRLAPSVTHVGLLTLLLGITITSWTGFTGFQPVLLDEKLNFNDSQHSKLWVGSLPTWKVRVDATRRENHPTGQAKQWFSTLSVVDDNNKVLSQGEISVNNPLTYDGVDIYQSSWGLAKVAVSFNGHKRQLDLRPMGEKYACFLPLDQDTVLIMSMNSEGKSLRVFAKRREWKAPKLISEVQSGKSVKLGDVDVTFEKAIAVTGLQYKRDPGLPITYLAFGIVMIGVLLAAVPHRHVWVAIDAGKLYIGGTSRKAKVGFERSMDSLVEKLKDAFALQSQPESEETNV